MTFKFALFHAAVVALMCATPWSSGVASAQICTREYRPVCAIDRTGAQRTFPNPCAARVVRARILYPGRCRTACPFIYQPVCAVDRRGVRRTRTFSNACVARNAGARPLHPGRCGSGR
jgi:hypothetical protein